MQTGGRYIYIFWLQLLLTSVKNEQVSSSRTPQEEGLLRSNTLDPDATLYMNLLYLCNVKSLSRSRSSLSRETWQRMKVEDENKQRTEYNAICIWRDTIAIYYLSNIISRRTKSNLLADEPNTLNLKLLCLEFRAQPPDSKIKVLFQT